MSTKNDVESFLRDFKAKMKIWDVVFLDDRGKNTQTLADLEITANDRKEILDKLKVEDYSEGPKEDEFGYGSDLWVFGKEVKEQEIYIKITLGLKGQSTICISFHVAEHPMSYPLKRK